MSQLPSGAQPKTLRSGSRLGKYRIERRIGEGAFATVYRAMDTLEGVRVALKVPHGIAPGGGDDELLRKEIRLAARLIHPRVLPLKTADVIDGRYVLAYPLGERTLADRIRSRLSLATALDYTEQLLEGVAFAHEQKVIHCDIKPDNLLLIDGELLLADFGIAKVATRTINASGSGTVGYCAPEQAMGKPSFRSDVFSAGLVICRMVSGRLPEWPFDWPPEGFERLKKRVHPDFLSLLKRSIELDPRKRFASGGQFYSAFTRLRPRIMKGPLGGSAAAGAAAPSNHWQEVQWRQFQRRYGQQLRTKESCDRCGGPVSEAMTCCPWCAKNRAVFTGETDMAVCCPRCHRGLKSEWRYCPWCYGAGFDVATNRRYSDKRYVGKCANTKCVEKDLMAFMRYCPWCHAKVARRWRIEGVRESCDGCGWGVLGEFWNHCPWCAKKLGN